MKVSPLRALTHFRLYVIFDFRNNVEMKVSPLRSLTHRHIYTELQSSLSRNESKPVEGIDTSHSTVFLSGYVFCRNESKPVEGIDTLLRRLLSCL